MPGVTTDAIGQALERRLRHGSLHSPGSACICGGGRGARFTGRAPITARGGVGVGARAHQAPPVTHSLGWSGDHVVLFRAGNDLTGVNCRRFVPARLTTLRSDH
jgi:hypothetical protein